MSSKTKNNFSIEEVNNTSFIIKKHYESDIVDIAYINYCNDVQDCYIKTISSNFQNNVFLYEDLVSFIYLVDYAYDELIARNK